MEADIAKTIDHIPVSSSFESHCFNVLSKYEAGEIFKIYFICLSGSFIFLLEENVPRESVKIYFSPNLVFNA